MKKLMTTTILMTLLSGCSLAPTYQRPSMPIPSQYKEQNKEDKLWVTAQSSKQPTKLKPWWEAFQDPLLNQLEDQLTQANQDLRVAFARYQEASALAQVARADLFPNIQGIFNIDRQQTSQTIANPANHTLSNSILLGPSLNYEIDLWGRIRNNVASSKSLAQASLSDLAAVDLSLHAELASDYFSLQGSDQAQRILDSTVKAYQKALDLTQRRFKGGVSPSADVYQAKAQLENAKTQAADMQLKRAQLEHAIAVLVGEIPANFKLKLTKPNAHLLSISPNLPSTLLERRPDIVAAESRVQSANAKIGVARAAFFPTVNLAISGGFESQTFSNLFSKPSEFWSLGPVTATTLTQPSVAMTLFDGGKLLGLLNNAKAAYFETAANYRQTVLIAFREVEDNLIAIRKLDQENRSQNAATIAAKQALNQSQKRYEGGIATFLDVVINENTALQSELAWVNLKTRRHLASIQLIKALGGGWYPERESS